MWLIIGYGNRLRGDDAAGLLLAEQLVKQLPAEEIRVLAVHQLTPELAAEISRPEIEQVLFLDCQRNQAEAVAINPVRTDANCSCGHQLSPALLLQLSSKLYNRNRSGWLLTIAGDEFAYTEQLSSAAKKNYQTALKQVTVITKRTFTNENLAVISQTDS